MAVRYSRHKNRVRGEHRSDAERRWEAYSNLRARLRRERTPRARPDDDTPTRPAPTYPSDPDSDELPPPPSAPAPAQTAIEPVALPGGGAIVWHGRF